jgi:hypothetical protein
MNIDNIIEKTENEISVLNNLLSWEKIMINSTFCKIDLNTLDRRSKRKKELIQQDIKLKRLKKYKQIYENNIKT